MGLYTLEDLYVEHLKDIYSAENQIAEALPRMSAKASTPELKSAFDKHLQVTQTQIQRLEKVFDRIQRRPGGKKCVGMEGLLQEGEELMSEDMDPYIMDSALIGAAQKVEHYEVSAYGTARAYARLLSDDVAVKFFTETLDEEAEADEELSSIADGTVNIAAFQR